MIPHQQFLDAPLQATVVREYTDKMLLLLLLLAAATRDDAVC